MDKGKVFDRIKGTLYGVAVGDCLGALVEFRTADEIRFQFGTVRDIGPSWLDGSVGRGTDDTAMTLAVAEGIMQTGPMDDPVERIGAEFVKWFREGPTGAGNICLRAIVGASHSGKVSTPKRDTWFKTAKAVHHALNGRSGGNGTLMRTAPVALFLQGEARDALAYDVSKMTHFDEDAADACVLCCQLIDGLIRGDDAGRKALDHILSGTEYERVIHPGAYFRPNPSGYVKDTFNAALTCFAHLKDFEDILVTVVNLGGDADTTGAVAGGLAGAAYGYSAIPARWIAALDDGLKARLDACVEAAWKRWE